MPDNPVNAGNQPPSPMPTVICTGTIHQRDPPFFTGTGDYDGEDWLSSHERVSTHNKWNDGDHLSNVHYYLTEAARTWYRNNEGTNIQTWGDFKTTFKAVFGRPEGRNLGEQPRLRGRAQQHGEISRAILKTLRIFAGA